jgi:hypothetical protein
MPGNLSAAQTAAPVGIYSSQINVRVLSALQKSGLQLSKLVLYIMAGFLLFVCSFLIMDIVKSPKSVNIDQLLKIPISDTALLSKRLEVVRTYHEQTKDSQLFLKEMSQMVLLNLLLPILTALLGYIFGSREEAS